MARQIQGRHHRVVATALFDVSHMPASVAGAGFVEGVGDRHRQPLLALITSELLINGESAARQLIGALDDLLEWKVQRLFLALELELGHRRHFRCGCLVLAFGFGLWFSAAATCSWLKPSRSLASALAFCFSRSVSACTSLVTSIARSAPTPAMS